MKATRNGKIRELRRILGQTQEAFAATIGASKDTVVSWETGRNPVSEGMARRIALATGVSPRSLLKGNEPLVTWMSRRTYTREEFEKNQKLFWHGTAEENARRHSVRCGDALELIFRAAAEEGSARLAAVLDAFIQWCQRTREDFRLEKAIDAQLDERKAKVEISHSYAQWREMAKTDPGAARIMGFKDDPKRSGSEMLSLGAELVPAWAPGHSMRGGRD